MTENNINEIKTDTQEAVLSEKKEEYNVEDHTSSYVSKQSETDNENLFAQMNADTTHQYVTFALKDEEYGVPILSVQEIISLPQITGIPNLPAHVMGVINLRGKVIPLVDLRVKFAIEQAENTKYSVVIVVTVEVGSDIKTIGLVVDKVSDVLSFTDENLQDCPTFNTSIKTTYIDKIGKIGRRLVILLDVQKLFSDDEIKELNIKE